MVYVTLSLVSSSWLYIAPDRSIMSCGRVSAVGAPGSVSCWFVCWCRCCEDPANVLLSREERHWRHVVTRRHTAAACNTTTRPPPATSCSCSCIPSSAVNQSTTFAATAVVRSPSREHDYYVYEKYLSMTHKIFI